MSELLEFSGQWIGHSQDEGGAQVLSVVNAEERSPGTCQILGATLGDERLRTCSDGRFEFKGDQVSGKTINYRVFDPQSDRLISVQDYFARLEIKERPPTQADCSAKYDGTKLFGEFTNDLGRKGTFQYWRTFSEAILGKPAPAPQIIGPLDWREFKEFVTRFRSYENVVFRGQHSNRYSLRTAFHRAKRNDLVRYVDEDIPRLRHRINAISTHYYHSNGEDFLGLLSLAQHHGYPTPLLDWTLSPYIAAFFAFDCLKVQDDWHRRGTDHPVRVFAFDLEEWRKFPRPFATSLKDPWPDLQFVQPAAHNNPRYFPQQSIAAFSNIDDVEGFITAFELKHGANCLHRIDIKADQRELVLQDLRFMGITGAVLFPGFEGICRTLCVDRF